MASIALHCSSFLMAASLPEIHVKDTYLTPDFLFNHINADFMDETLPLSLEKTIQHISGVDTVGLSGLGQPSFISLRGNNFNHTAVRVNGLKINDPSSPQGTFNVGSSLAPLGQTLHVIKGSNTSSSDTIGGALHFTPQKGYGKPTHTIRSFMGNHGTYGNQLYSIGQINRFHYNISANNYHTQGHNTVPVNLRKTPRDFLTDKVDLHNLSGRFDVTDPSQKISLTYTGNYNDGTSFYNKRYGLSFARGEDQQHYHTLRGQYKTVLKKNISFLHRLSYGTLLTTRDDRDLLSKKENDYSRKGQRQHIAYTAQIKRKNIGFQTHLKYEIETMKSYKTPPFLVKDLDVSGKLEKRGISFKPFIKKTKMKHIFYARSWVSFDHFTSFGTKKTYGIHFKHTLPTKTYYGVGYKTAFNTPTPYQLYAKGRNFTGERNLKPESSKGYDVTLGQTWGRFKVEATYFKQTIKDILQSVYKNNVYTYENQDKAFLRGIETQASYRGTMGWVKVSNMIIKTYNHHHQPLLRRPTSKLTWACAYTGDDMEIGQETVYRGRYYDHNDITHTREKGKAFSVTHLFMHYDVRKDFRVFSRIDNVFNKSYQEILNYDQAGRLFIVGGQIRL